MQINFAGQPAYTLLAINLPFTMDPAPIITLDSMWVPGNIIDLCPINIFDSILIGLNKSIFGFFSLQSHTAPSWVKKSTFIALTWSPIDIKYGSDP